MKIDRLPWRSQVALTTVLFAGRSAFGATTALLADRESYEQGQLVGKLAMLAAVIAVAIWLVVDWIKKKKK